jgi:nicotinamidase-related amidase
MMENTALMIVDVQVAMFSQEDEQLYHGDEILEKIRLLLEKVRKSQVPVVFIQHTEEDGEYAEGTPSWQIHPSLAPAETEAVVQKRTWDAFHKTALDATLKAKGIRNLIIAGMQTEFCLDTTCRRAFSMGYKSVLVEDAHTTFDSKVLRAPQIIAHHNLVLGGRFVQLKTAEDIEF